MMLYDSKVPHTGYGYTKLRVTDHSPYTRAYSANSELRVTSCNCHPFSKLVFNALFRVSSHVMRLVSRARVFAALVVLAIAGRRGSDPRNIRRPLVALIFFFRRRHD